MKRVLALTVAIALAFGVIGTCFAASPEKKAKACANSWLELVDGKKYAESYDAAASLFKGMMKKEDWVSALSNLRSMLKGVVSRKLVSVKYQATMPGAPDGEYVILVYKTKFDKKDDAQEVVVPMLDSDGRWRVSGYHIK